MLVLAAVFSATESVTPPRRAETGCFIDISNIDCDGDGIGQTAVGSRHNDRIGGVVFIVQGILCFQLPCRAVNAEGCGIACCRDRIGERILSDELPYVSPGPASYPDQLRRQMCRYFVFATVFSAIDRVVLSPSVNTGASLVSVTLIVTGMLVLRLPSPVPSAAVPVTE